MLKFSGEFSFQSHPSVNINLVIEQFNEALAEQNRKTKAKIGFTLNETTFHTGPINTFRESVNQEMTKIFLVSVQQHLIKLPADGNDYINALGYVETSVLPKKLTAENIIAITKQVAKLVYPKGNGQYRLTQSYVFDSRIMPCQRNKESFPQLDKFFKRNENADVYPIWVATTRAYLWNKEFAKEKKNILPTADDFKCLARISIGNPAPEQIASLMNEVKQVIQSTDDCYTIAARVHQTIVKIHPFEDANGRTARIMMNIILLQAGQNSLIIDSDEKYSKAVNEDQFEPYLRDLTTRQPQSEKIISLAFRFFANCRMIDFGYKIN